MCRVWDRLMALAAVGATPGGGVNRQALTHGEAEAWRLLIGWGAEAGMECSTDPAGNLFLALAGRDRSLPPLLLGSHIDTQPTGGRFDGTFGVLAGLEAAARLAEGGTAPARDVVVVAWMNEEGSRFAPGMMGSEAFAGVRTLADILAADDAAGTTVGAALGALHAAFPDLPRRALGFRPAAYLEAHIEQGPVLEAAGLPLGIVTGIQGKTTWEVVLGGAEGHAGTLDMGDRRDAVAAFARVAHGMFGAMAAFDAAVKFTIGRLEVTPNAPSVVPGRVVFRIDLRHPDNAVLAAAGARLEAIAQAQAPPCTAAIRRLVDAPSTAFDAALLSRLEDAAARLGHRAMRLPSAAGHDARHAALLCPAAMLFIPCRGGASHVEHEWAEPAHVAAGTDVLAAVVRTLVEERTMDVAPIDMADLPVQHPAAPRTDAAARARFFNSGNAFNIKRPAVPAAEFSAVLARAAEARAATGVYPCDQGPAMACPFPATTPLMLASYVRVRAGAEWSQTLAATAGIFSVLRGAGTACCGADRFAWGAGDVFLLPGGIPATLAAQADALLWHVGNAPMLALDGSQPAARAALPAVHYPAAEIERQLALLAQTRSNASTSGLALIFSSAGLEAGRTMTPSLTLSLNTLPPGQRQRAHRHNAAAITLAVQGEGCFSMVDGARCPWTIGSTLVTPPGAPHSHHNPGGIQARFLIVQDGGLHTHARTMGFEFLEAG